MKSVCDKYGALFILDEVCLTQINLAISLTSLLDHEWHGPYVSIHFGPQTAFSKLVLGMGTLHAWESFGDGAQVIFTFINTAIVLES